MRKNASIRTAVEKARRRHEQIAYDRAFGEGRIGDEELTALLEVPYPSVAGQRN
ncbi:MAG TPA: hypothetical protein VN213_14305 [Solirubrobacteraceae bacterium]|nr:hypothetical protein [Solirubrobacteraceae bacterium]